MKLSATAMKLWVLVTERPGNYSKTEVLRDLNVGSKAKIIQAATELEEAGLITTEIEDE